MAKRLAFMGAGAVGSYFGGPHPGGMNALFADGSVKTINFNISQVTFAALCRRDDGVVINASELP